MASSRRLPAHGLRALITNDDGVDASGVGGSVLAVREDGRVRLHPRELPGLEGVPAFGVEGHPAFIVHSAARGWLDPAPDVVLSGVNFGSNVGRAVLHSGTVGAALTAGIHGWRALAVSLDSGWEAPEHPHWDAVHHVLPSVLDILLGEDAGTVLNLNVPDRAPGELAELREARLAAFGAVQVRVDHRSGDDGHGLHMSLGESTPPVPGTDTALLLDGHPTLTRLETIGARPGVLGAAVTAVT